jgi:energy-coupling factor transport system ATP-binding protein
MAGLVADGLSFRYPGGRSPALSQVSLAIEHGEVVLVAGPSGCGKSTLALALAGLIPGRIRGRPAGSVRYRGQRLAGLEPHEIAQRIGMVFQDPSSQLVCPSVEAEVAFGPENLGLDRGEIRRRVETSLAATGMTGMRLATTATLSGGEKQRLAVAATLAMQPEVLVLDEPCSDLDPAGTQEVLAVLHRLNRERGMTIVLVEHRIDDVIPWVDRVVLLDRGQIVLDEPARRAFSAPGRWSALGVAVPEMVQIGQGMPEVFGGAVPLSVGEAAAGLAGTVWARQLARPAEPVSTASQTAGPAAIEWAGVHLGYPGVRVLEGVDLRVSPGEWLALAGPNGSGKTSLLELAMGFTSPTAGSVCVGGTRVKASDVSRQARRIGYLFQSADTMLFTSSVEQELLFALRHRRRQRGPAASGVSGRAAIGPLLELAGLAGRAQSDPFALSAGQRQRLAIAALLVESPATLILDEPTTGQDEGHARAMLGFLSRLRREAGLTYLMVTHDMRVVARHAQRLAVLGHGRVLADDAPAAVFARGDVLEAASLVAPPAAELHRRLAPGTARVSLTAAQLLAAMGATAPATVPSP